MKPKQPARWLLIIDRLEVEADVLQPLEDEIFVLAIPEVSLVQEEHRRPLHQLLLGDTPVPAALQRGFQVLSRNPDPRYRGVKLQSIQRLPRSGMKLNSYDSPELHAQFFQ